MISGNLEYLMSSLPNLSLDEQEEVRLHVFELFRKYENSTESNINLIEVLENEAAKFLNQKQFNLFQSINLDEIHSEKFQNCRYNSLKSFSEFSFNLKKSIYELRMSRMTSPKNTVAEPAISFLNPGNPIEEELQIIQYQWSKIEELSLGHYADFESLILYRLKILLLIRLWSFDTEEGYAHFLTLTTTHHGR